MIVHIQSSASPGDFLCKIKMPQLFVCGICFVMLVAYEGAI